MSTDKSREEDRATQEKAQKTLTTSVGTPLVKPEKTSRRKLFGRRREQSAAE